MTPAVTLLRKALLLFCSAASWSVHSCESIAQNAPPPTERVDDLRSELHRLVFLKGTNLDAIDANRLSDRDYKRISDEQMRASGNVLNLAPWERIVALRKEYLLMSEYEQTHPVRSHGEREAESKWLVDQILRDTK